MRSSSEYRIEKVRRPLQVHLIDGGTLEGEVFLRPVSRYRSRPEEPIHLLNDDEPYFAMMRTGEAILVAKASVARAITTSQGDDEDVHVATPGIPVEVTMTDGTVCIGSIFPESRSGRPRLLDFLNAYRDRFIPVVDATKVCLVNKNVIAHVREVG